MFARSRSSSSPAAAEPFGLPDPGLADPVRAFAYDALRRAVSVCWLVLEVGLDDAVAALAGAEREFGRSGIRWSGAGVLRSSGLQWFGFDAGDRSLVAVPDSSGADRLAAERFRALTRALAAGPWRTLVLTDLPADLLAALESARAVPAWEVAGLAHLAPEALTAAGAATMAA